MTLSADYLRGYDSGYHAKRRAKPPVTYRRQYWQCSSCETKGMVLLRSDDTPTREAWRIKESHRAQRTRRHCPTPRLVRV